MLMILRTIWTIVIISMIMIIPATPVAAYQTNVNVNAPERVDGDFDVTIEIKNVVDLDSGQFDLYFDSSAVNVTGIDDGNIDGTTIPIDNWVVGENKIRVLFNLPGIDGVSGSGSLATIHFKTIVSGDCVMEMSDGLLVDTMADAIPTSWDGVESVITKPKTSIQADTTENETSGFGALFSIGVLAAVYLAFRKKE
jgi:hypothetical protein